MVEKQQVVSFLEERGAMGTVLEVLTSSSVERTHEKYEKIRQKLLSYPSGEVEVDVLNQYLEEVLHEEEVVLVLFKKAKRNGKIGQKKEFDRGYSYYVGRDPENLSKIYIHWGRDKKFLLQNINTLNKKFFFIDKSGIDCMSNIFFLNISLCALENKKIMYAEISIYIGYSLKG